MNNIILYFTDTNETANLASHYKLFHEVEIETEITLNILLQSFLNENALHITSREDVKVINTL